MKGMRSISPMGVRIPDELKEKIQEQAKLSGRSMNAEIVSILENSFTNTEKVQDEESEKLIEAYKDRFLIMDKLIKTQANALELSSEQISLLKQFIKQKTGIDVQAFFDSIHEQRKQESDESKKPT